MYKSRKIGFIVLVVMLMISGSIRAERFMEKLDRGVVAVYKGSSQVYVGWRMFGTDPADIAFNLYLSIDRESILDFLVLDFLVLGVFSNKKPQRMW